MVRALRCLFLFALFVPALSAQGVAAELKPQTRQAFDRYVELVEKRLRSNPTPFLWVRSLPELQRARYEVQYREFDGPHTVPPDIAKEAIAWLAQ